MSCHSGSDPAFGGDDIEMSNHCNAGSSYTRIGIRCGDLAYANDSPAVDFVMGAINSHVKEIEVFWIADEAARPADLEKCVNGSLFQEMGRKRGGPVSDRFTFLIANRQEHEDRIAFCPSHFFEFGSLCLCEPNIDILSSIISNGSVQLRAEVVLFKFLHTRVLAHSNDSSLFQVLRFKCPLEEDQ
jgi:hypothetical protein